MKIAYNAIILAGGRSSRMGPGRNKVTLQIEGRPLVATAVEAVATAENIVLVGPPEPLQEALPGTWPKGLTSTREYPPFGGPVAGILAGLTKLGDRAAPITVLLACDVPRAASAIEALLDSGGLPQLLQAGGPDGICALDGEGFPQRLLGFYRTQYLIDRSREVAGQNMSVRRFLDGANLQCVPVPEDYLMDLDSVEDVKKYLLDAGKRKEGKASVAEVKVTYYAGMVDRAGTASEEYTGVGTLSDLKEAIISRHGESIATPLAACSFLVDGQVVQEESFELGVGGVEVLPPFAGG